MSTSNAALDPISAERMNLPVLTQLLGSVVSSSQPAVVFSSIAHLCVPTLCATSTVALAEADQQSYTIANPRDRVRPDHADTTDDRLVFGGVKITRDSVVTTLRGRSTEHHPGFEGVLVMDFAEPRPEHALLAQLVANHGVSLVELERAGETAQAYRRQAENLTTALETNREIAVAIGIVMSRDSRTEEQAFELLRQASQDTQRKLRDIAADVVRTGELDLPLGPSTRPAHHPRRHRPPTPISSGAAAADRTFTTHYVAAENRLEVAGELDILTTPRMVAAAAQTRPGCDLILDVAKVTFLDVSVLGTLVELHRALRCVDLGLTVVGASPRVARTFALGRVAWLLGKPDRRILEHLSGAVVAAAKQSAPSPRDVLSAAWTSGDTGHFVGGTQAPVRGLGS